MSKNYKSCILLVCNEGFLKPVLFVCNQLVANSKRKFDIVIASGENLKSLIPESIHFKQVNMDDFTQQLPEIPRLKKFTYWRIPAIQELSTDYDRILYLDSDVYINDPSEIDKLLSMHMGNHAIAAVLDVHQHVKTKRIAQEHKVLGISSTPYFNAGLLLISCSQWKKMNFFAKICKLSKKQMRLLFCHDQSLLNLATEGEWLELSPSWNWQYSYRNCFITEMVSPNIIHFAGATKLWDTPNGHTPKRYWNAYQDYLKSTGLNQSETFPKLSKAIFKYWTLSFLKNIWYFKSYRRYLERFDDSLSTQSHPKSFDLP
jgi:lipopolysaccharide biosynthesis glycosyltransferase